MQKIIHNASRAYRRWFPVFGLGMVLALLAALYAPLRAQSRGPAVGRRAPEFTAKDLDGRKVSIANYKGKVLLIEFWASWCGPCHAEAPNLVRTYRKYNSRGFEILGINTDQDKSKIRPFLRKYGITWPQVADVDMSYALSNKYGATRIPMLVLVDGTSGAILEINPRGNTLDGAVAMALKERDR